MYTKSIQVTLLIVGTETGSFRFQTHSLRHLPVVNPDSDPSDAEFWRCFKGGGGTIRISETDQGPESGL